MKTNLNSFRVNRLIAVIGIASALLAGFYEPVRADVAYTTLASDGTFNGGGNVIVGTSSPDFAGTYESLAGSFIPTINGNLSSIQVGISAYPGDDGNFTLSLDSDNPSGGPLVAPSLTSANLVAVSSYYDTSALTTFIYSGPTLSLAEGTTYWIVATPTDSQTEAVWGTTKISTSSLGEYSTDGTTYQNSFNKYGFQISVVATPDPSTWTMMVAGTGLLLLWHYIARRVTTSSVG